MRLFRSIFAALRSRPAVAVLLVYQALFLNVLLPGHTRGAITLDGKHTAACCCCGSGGEAGHGPRGGGPSVPSQRDRDHCALCNFAARVVPPDVTDLRLAPLGLVDVLPSPRPAVVASADRIVTYYGRGPPGPA